MTRTNRCAKSSADLHDQIDAGSDQASAVPPSACRFDIAMMSPEVTGRMSTDGRAPPEDLGVTSTPLALAFSRRAPAVSSSRSKFLNMSSKRKNRMAFKWLIFSTCSSVRFLACSHSYSGASGHTASECG
ncbi:MAG: hypothetical protein JWO52_765 [Gammaproteobacteria bacterium]|jgi:hypothetical protein|nr:hypothetical protein [Gammaproteobacteria bacterium]